MRARVRELAEVAKRSLTEGVEKRKEEIGSAARCKGGGAWRNTETRKVFVLWTAASSRIPREHSLAVSVLRFVYCLAGDAVGAGVQSRGVELTIQQLIEEQRDRVNSGNPVERGFPGRPYPGDYLPQHTTFDLSLGKDFGERFSTSLTALNVANRRVEYDNSLTFGGFHWNPREIYLELRYRFHY